MDRATFFAFARRAPFGGALTQEQVEGCEAILNAWQGSDDRHLAYILATAFHETAGTMAPVREGSTRTRRLTDAQARRVVASRRYGKPDKDTGHVYYGRGHVQLTWKANYEKMGRALGLDLVNNPDLALDLNNSVRILIEGMTEAQTDVCDFTGKCLSDYFNDRVSDPEGARRIVNGTDKASLIAGYYQNFSDSIDAARKEAAKSTPTPAPVVQAAKPDGPDLKKDKTAIGGGVLTGAGLLGAASAAKPIIEGINNPWAFGALALILILLAIGAYMTLTGRIDLKRIAGA